MTHNHHYSSCNHHQAREQSWFKEAGETGLSLVSVAFQDDFIVAMNNMMRRIKHQHTAGMRATEAPVD